ncbi:hypothetical protein CONPUDRAFT_134601 [Coniophora puteana RWD-64-598 SS2]|uniref:Amidohydrolase-related domain-containing protein n=1 Tax=Coniophora puteana (strain RWD-64-598) TaxID=741705 RepID=A0A5M3N036_CONPW|nr:uncharacterized protein CONPUDRAFT_134601 [Coniophora puteana RWD-64-598 SS2]EIW84617.1 hypothetical protein CONPUDRAFT_134601 [Coniophora puteana RWD-64-598 SS2]
MWMTQVLPTLLNQTGASQLVAVIDDGSEFKQPQVVALVAPTPSPQQLAQRARILSRCEYLSTPAGPPSDFAQRTRSDRFVPGTRPVLLRNARIWTGGNDGTEVLEGDVYLEDGIVKAVGSVSHELLDGNLNVQVLDVNGSWVTPGIVDLHSHIGVNSAPDLNGADDTNSFTAPILPWLRASDGLNTHDASYALVRSGGVTTAQVLPGSADNIGGQAIVVKLRDTLERTPTSMMVEPPWELGNGTKVGYDSSKGGVRPRWRHMKHACGENPSNTYGQTRMDSAWLFRQAYDTARKLRDSQDAFCTKARAGRWDELDQEAGVPEDLQWEALADVLRGKVKLSVHCYEAVDLDMIVRLSHEFQFPVASFHHAGETYLVPDLLKKTFGGPPTIALFASNARKKREAYRASPFAPALLSSPPHSIPVAMKSDHPVTNARYLPAEAAYAHFWGLGAARALSALTTVPADALGMGHRLGRVRVGWDADVVVWDRHPLELGAVPRQVFVDGVAQLASTGANGAGGASKSGDEVGLVVPLKSAEFQDAPRAPDFGVEMARTIEFEGLPPLEPRRVEGRVVFANVSEVWVRDRRQTPGGVTRVGTGMQELAGGEETDGPFSVEVYDGQIARIHLSSTGHSQPIASDEVVDLQGGVLVPGLTTFGTRLGLSEIKLEPSTNDGSVFNPLDGDIPAIVGKEPARAVDGLMFGGRNMLLAYRNGVTSGVAAPGGSFVQGTPATFLLGAPHALAGAVIEADSALHVTLGMGAKASVSTQIAALRAMLFDERAAEGGVVRRVRKGDATLVITVDTADIMATLIQLKSSLEERLDSKVKMTFAGALEAHLLAAEIAHAGIGVVLTRAKPFPGVWGQRRILEGPPVTPKSALEVLLGAGVDVALGVVDEFNAQNTRFEIGWELNQPDSTLTSSLALELGTTRLERVLGVKAAMPQELVAYKGGTPWGFESKVVGVVSQRMGRVDLFE